jgi:periplasmic protein TonB
MKGGNITAQLVYVGKLRANLERSKVNPGTTFAGTVVVRFTVNAKGELVSRKIVASSGNQFLDEAALASVERGSPFPGICGGKIWQLCSS